MRVLHGFMKAFAIILCIVLFFGCFASVTLSVTVDLIKVDTLRRIITQVDWFDLMGESDTPYDDPYGTPYIAAVPYGCLTAGVRLPLAAMAMPAQNDSASDLPFDEGALEDAFEDVDLAALGAEMEKLLQSEEMEAFLTYAETYIEEHPVFSEMDEQQFAEALESQAVNDAVKDLTNELVELLLTEDRANYDVERMGKVVDKHAPKICAAMGVELEDEFFEKAKDAVKSVAKGVAESEVLPPADQLMDVVISGAISGMGNDTLYRINALLGLPADAAVSETVAALRSLMNTAATIMWVCVVVLVGLIALLWWHLYRWTLPVGITLLLSGGFAFAVGAAGNVILRMMSAVQPLVAEIADAAVLSRFTLYGGILLGVGVLCIAAYIVLRIVLRKKAAQPSAVEVPVSASVEPPMFKDSVKG